MQVKETYDELCVLAYKDTQLNVFNRNYYNRYLSNKFGIFALIDVNGLKKTNDTFGHQAGDQLLLRVVRKLQRYGTVTRIGGDEFVLQFNSFVEYGKFTNQIHLEFAYSIGVGILSEIFLQLDSEMYKSKIKTCDK